ncbi:hypothetical protein OZX67_05410 [Bifidobacterium sp. ESL0728]|uniref:hypothetical protein n=1 Tax=Bifidobacterium sp. ESL0728 TaxID=2983220 RepID=UPI0023F832AF|nr:hypothetical protein [Bifidobacterium sp. ESL0728]WEV58277.1 hypothetical protein OZX67_05410 [Bifidobacterium sp. ESL0728]
MRSEFGTITYRKNRKGEAVSLLARYTNPFGSGQQIKQVVPVGVEGVGSGLARR